MVDGGHRCSARNGAFEHDLTQRTGRSGDDDDLSVHGELLLRAMILPGIGLG
jgi:hypothetical protein